MTTQERLESLVGKQVHIDMTFRMNGSEDYEVFDGLLEKSGGSFLVREEEHSIVHFMEDNVVSIFDGSCSSSISIILG